jgi:hypothetical protein
VSRPARLDVFTTSLHIHHTAEDEALGPALRQTL